MAKKSCKGGHLSKAGKTLSTSKNKKAKSKAAKTLVKHKNKYHK